MSASVCASLRARLLLLLWSGIGEAEGKGMQSTAAVRHAAMAMKNQSPLTERLIEGSARGRQRPCLLVTTSRRTEELGVLEGERVSGHASRLYSTTWKESVVLLCKAL
jgi:hypothetical protein